MNKTIQFYKKNNYGNLHYYIATHCGADMFHVASQIRKLTGRSTLTASDMNALRGLGFEFVETLAPDSAWISHTS